MKWYRQGVLMLLGRPRQSASSSRARRTSASSLSRTLVACAAALLGTFALGPPLLVLLKWLYPFDWNPLSSIGQSYTGISALLSAGALIAVAASIQFQAREVKLNHTLAVHDSQRELIKMAMDDPDLLPCVGASMEVQERRRLYNTLWLRYYELSYTTGHLSAARLAFVLEHERFVVPSVREHWARVADFWKDFGSADFVAIVEHAYRAALTAAAE